MKRLNKKGSQRSRPDRPDERRYSASSTARPPLSPGRRRLFLIVTLLLPFLALGLLELGLRVAGYGCDTAFFQTERDASGKKFLLNNDRFTFRFLTPELARWPVTFKFAAEKPPDVQRLFIFGESAAMGDPQPLVGASRYLEILLREKFPGQKFEVVNLGITAINSHVILPIAQEVAARGEGDFWLIYMGNNEMVGPFGAATVFGSRAPPLSLARLNLAIQKTRVGQLAVSSLRRLGRKPANGSWGGMGMFLQNQIPPDDARRETVYHNFAGNLRDVVQAGHQSGAKIVLSTMSVNLRDCPPFGSMLNSNLPAAEQAQFDSPYADALALQTNQHPAEAALKFEQAARLDPKFAELQFRWAQCLLDGTNPAAAREHFQQACDVDTLPFRADTRINGVIRSLAAELAGTNVAFCDAETALAAATAEGIAGDETFFEHVHFNFDGNYRLAKIWAEQIARLLPEAVRRTATAGWASQEVCERAIGLSDWNRLIVISSVVARMGLPPLAGQFNNAARLQVLQRELNVLKERQRPTNALAQARAEFSAAIAHAPGDASLHLNYANFLEVTRDTQAALAEYLKVVELLPHDIYSCLQAGRLLGAAGRLAEARPLLQRACALRPYLPDAWFESGVVFGLEAKHAEALACFERAAQLSPDNATYLIHQARTLSKLNRHAEAIQSYRNSIKADSRSLEAHSELAGELAATDQVDEAIKEYTEFLRLNPRHVVTRVNLGVMLARQNRLDEAIQQFENALALDPNCAAATDYLRQISARRNQR